MNDANAPHPVRILTGPHRSQRAEAIDGLLRDALDRALLIVPTRRYARARTVAIIERFDLSGVLGQPVLSFEDFVASIVAGTPYEQRRIDPTEQRICLERAIAHVADSNGLETLATSAATEGFLRHIQRVIGQLKQGAIEPREFEARVASRRSARPIDRAVSRIYSAYQTILQDRGAYDLQGLYWMANLCCAESAPPALANGSTLLVDDFDDFTPSEFRVLVSLRRHAALTFGLRLELQPGRADLYALPLKTLRRLRDAFDATPESFDAGLPESQTEYLTAHIFWRDKPSEFAGARENLRLIACHDQRHELETGARSETDCARTPRTIDRNRDRRAGYGVDRGAAHRRSRRVRRTLCVADCPAARHDRGWRLRRPARRRVGDVGA
jgi:ATP-dependent helicase/DNAse subunit B